HTRARGAAGWSCVRRGRGLRPLYRRARGENMREHASETAAGALTRTVVAPSVNVTPLIDILLVLLIIFMVLTPLRPARFKALVPEEPAPRQQQHLTPDPLTLVVV